MRALAIGLAVAAMITDVLDGYIARRNNEISDLGKILDPLADKIYLSVVGIQLLLLGMLPLWVVAMVVARDLLILAGGIAIERRLGVVLPSNYPGKAAVVSLSITLLLIIGGAADKITSFMIGLSLILLLISLYLYAERAVLTLRGRK
jgi:phosphatidylglycerophosphate synthase